MQTRKIAVGTVSAVLVAAGFAGPAMASSHREAPFITQLPKVDATDFYLFRSYESGRSGYVTLIANYVPLQDAYGGPNYFAMNENALYEIHVDNDGDAVEDITFQFRFDTEFKNIKLPTGTTPDGEQVMNPIPLINAGVLTGSEGSLDNLNRTETYTVTVVRGDRRTGEAQPVTGVGGEQVFTKPVDNIGNKSIPDYAAYAGDYIYDVNIPGCSMPGRVFSGQRHDGFVVNLGEVFDLVNFVPLESATPPSSKPNTLEFANVTSLAVEVPIDCLTAGGEPVIGGWTSASLPQARVLNPEPDGTTNSGPEPKGPQVAGGAWTQVSRMGAPLVNELVIGLPDKNKFNASEPKGDAQFANYVLYPTLPVLLNALFGDAAMVPATPRNDLVAAFLTGIVLPDGTNLNQPADVVASEMLRLNTGIPATPAASQMALGVLGDDNAGFPNGRRPFDDVVDIELRVAMGALCGVIGECGTAGASDPNGGKAYTDGARATSAADDYLTAFPYLEPPIPGSPNGENGISTN